MQICGTLSATALMRLRGYSRPASRAIAIACNTVFVDPPIAMSRAKASSRASAVKIFRGVMSLSMRSRMSDAAFFANASRSGVRASAEPLNGSAMPNTSIRQFIELAVNIPEHDPQEGQAKSSNTLSRASSIFPACSAPTPSKTEMRSTVSPSGVLPAAIGPPETKMAGMSTRIAAINIPGTILSQLGMHTMPSNRWASIMVSTQSAMSSREGKLNFIPL